MQRVSEQTLQAATTIILDAETLVGQVIECGSSDFITFFIDYVNGDETTLLLTPYFMQSLTGTAYSDQSWSAASGTRSVTENVYALTASGNVIITLDLRGVSFVKLMATADNSGTPTGTLAVAYTLTAS